MNHWSSKQLRNSALVLTLGFLASGCLDVFDEGGETNGEPRRGDDVDAESIGGLGSGGVETGSGGASDGGSGGADGGTLTGGTGNSTGGATGGSGVGDGGTFGDGTGGQATGGNGTGGGGNDGGSGGFISDGGSPGTGGSDPNSTGGGSNSGLEDWQEAALDKHNEVRALHCVPEMTWNDEAAAFAQEWAEGLCPTMSLNHSSGSGFGENLYMSWGTGSTADLVESAIGAVEGWYGEIEDYDYGNPGFASGTGHFTQVVWEGSTGVGCGIATCTVSQWNVVVVSCNYSPPGNYTNQFEENVPPLCQ